jgi:hypothetical protein
MHLRIFLIFIFLTSVFVNRVFAHGDDKKHSDKDRAQFFQELADWKVGQTVTYSWKKKVFSSGVTQVNQRQYILTVVGQQEVDGANYVWVEMDTSKNGSTYFIQQYLLPPQSTQTLVKFLIQNNSAILNPVAMITQREDSSAFLNYLTADMELGVEKFLSGFHEALEGFSRDKSFDEKNILKTPAGTFESKEFSQDHPGIHFKIWTSFKVPILATVKVHEYEELVVGQPSSGYSETDFELVSESWDGGKSQLTKTPVALSGDDSVSLIQSIVNQAQVSGKNK